MEEKIDLSMLTQAVAAHFVANAAQYGLNPERVTARYILNWGGFVNDSFTISDGERAYHLKLAGFEDSLEGLEHWHELAPILTERYRAPAVIDWIEIDLETESIEGLLFEHIPGSPANFDENPALFGQVLDLLGQLHQDRELRSRLKGFYGPPGTCADYFIDTYIDRFDEDLLAVVRDLPPFVSLDLLSWMQGETRHLEALVRELPAFQKPANSPCHGDLWVNNILVTPDDDWRVIDWDDLALGDPALEYSILLSRLWRRQMEASPRSLFALPGGIRGGSLVKERILVCLRAYLLDMIIDSLADYVESAFAPEHQAEVQTEKEREHKSALKLYQVLYPFPI